MDDLAHQLALTVRDNALSSSGIASLRGLLSSGCPATALGELVIERDQVVGPRPQPIHNTSRPSPKECAAIAGLIPRLSRLRLSRHEPIAALIRGVLLRAAASSPAALEGVLRRYRRLLLHVQDAFRAGQIIDRAELRRLTGELGDQLVWWELLPPIETESEIDLRDLNQLDELIGAARAAYEADEKLGRLRQVLSDGIPTLVFTCSRDTVRYIRDQLGGPGVAWCTGERAGIGRVGLPRRAVLEWFRGPTTSGQAPQHLVVTDVAAEGLDLQRAGRVVHYDLPWNPMRLEQREGRSVRYGSPYREIEVVQLVPPTVLDRMLRLQLTLARKARLPATAGLGPDGERVWRWRDRLADRFRKREARAGVAMVPWRSAGLLAGFSIFPAGDPGRSSPAAVLWIEPDGSWTETPEIIAARLDSAAARDEIFGVPPDRLRDWLSLLARPIRERLTLMQGQQWTTPDPTPAARCLVGRFQRLVREAARWRQARRLECLEGALAFVGGGHTAGEAMLLERLAGVPDRELEAAIRKFPKARSGWNSLEVRLTGLIIFGSRPGELCTDCKPLSSISTGP